MCKDHGKVFGKDSVILLTEARLDASICGARMAYLEEQVKSFIEYLNDMGEDGKAIVLSIHERTMKELEENIMDEFIWTVSREEDDSLLDLLSGNDDVEFRLDEEEELHSDYWGMLHNIAYKAERKYAKEEGEEIFKKAQEFCDKLEEYFDPSQEKPLRKDAWKQAMKAKEKINLHRFKLKTITYNQWATIINHLNALLSVEKQYDVDDMEDMVNPEELAWEVEQVFYTRD